MKFVPAARPAAVFGLALGLAYFIAAALSIARFGSGRPRTFGLLFASESRFSDSTNLITLGNGGDLYAAGFQYPPGAGVILEVLRHGTTDAAGLTQIVVASLSMGVLVGAVGFRDADWRERIGAGVLAALVLYFVSTHVDAYAQVLGIIGGLSMLVGLIGIATTSGVPRLCLIPAIASSYPLVFSVDRGNFETYAFAMVAVSAALTFGFSRGRGPAVLGGAIFGLAVAVKVLPITLLGVQSGRQRVGLFVASSIASLALATGAGLKMLDTSPAAVLPALAGNNAASAEGYAWALFYGRGLFQATVYSLVEFRGFAAMESTISPIASVFPFLGLPLVLALMACGFLIPGKLWMRYTSVASGAILFANAAVLYRVSILTIALVIWLASSSQVDIRRESITAVLFALALSPYAFGLISTPLGFDAPSDTVYGTAGLLALFSYVTWRWLRGGTNVLALVRRPHGFRQRRAQQRPSDGSV